MIIAAYSRQSIWGIGGSEADARADAQGVFEQLHRGDPREVGARMAELSLLPVGDEVAELLRDPPLAAREEVVFVIRDGRLRIEKTRLLILVHGLPDVGKTTLCQGLAADGRFAHIDMGRDPRFRSMPMADLAALMIAEADRGQSIFLIEACVPNRRWRDRFVRRVLDASEAAGVIFARALIVYLHEPDEAFLTSRWDRDMEIKAAIEPGSDRHAYLTYESTVDEREDKEKRRDRVLGLLAPFLPL
jgi:hypothetical protein